MTHTILHCQVSENDPWWYVLECAKTAEQAINRARQYALDHGGYVCVKEGTRVVFGTDPVELDRAISNGLCRHFTRSRARRLGCCA